MSEITEKRCYYCDCLITEDNEHHFKKELKLAPDTRVLVEGSVGKLLMCKDCYKKKSGRSIKRT